MDEYLIPGKSQLRLINEYNKHESLVIAFDFDNTVYDFHKKGYTYFSVIELLQDLKKIGCEIICFTANEDHQFIYNYCKKFNIPLDKLNQNPDFFECHSRKIYFNALLDDRAGLIQVYTELKTVVEFAKQKQQ